MTELVVNVPYHEVRYPALFLWVSFSPALRADCAECIIYSWPQSAGTTGALRQTTGASLQFGILSVRHLTVRIEQLALEGRNESRLIAQSVKHVQDVLQEYNNV